jgi:hypothetical protein
MFKPFNRYAQFNPPSLVLPRDGEDEGEGLLPMVNPSGAADPKI